MSEWIVVPHWRRFQHYKDRTPPWIKGYTDILLKPEYRALSEEAKLLLHQIWLLYAATNGRILVASTTLSEVLAKPDLLAIDVALEDLVQAGFLKIASKPPKMSNASPRARAKRRGEKIRKESDRASAQNQDPARDPEGLTKAQELLARLNGQTADVDEELEPQPQVTGPHPTQAREETR